MLPLREGPGPAFSAATDGASVGNRFDAFGGSLMCPLPARQIAAAILPSRCRNPGGAQGRDSVYKVIELIGTSSESWEKAARTAVERAAKSLRDLRIAEVTAQDVQLKDGKVELFRTKLKVSFKYEKGSD